MTLAAWLMLAACVLIETVEQCLYRFAGVRPSVAGRCVAGAIGLHAAGLCLWLLLLQSRPLGYLLPLMGVNFVTIALAGRLLFREKITPRRIAGIALVLLGFVLVALDKT